VRSSRTKTIPSFEDPMLVLADIVKLVELDDDPLVEVPGVSTTAVVVSSVNV
jgi:hypothetical protein